MSQGAHHPTDLHLASLLDGSLLESDARSLRQHLDACGPCRDRLVSFEGVVRALEALPPADDSMIPEALRRARQRPPAPRALWYLVPAVVTSAAAALLFLVWPGSAEDPGLVARGADQPPLASVHLEVFQIDPATSRARALEGGERLASTPLSLAVAIGYLPDGIRHVAVYARDSAGRVTWLAPTWSAAETTPACLVLPASAGAIPVTSAVTLEQISAGALEVGLLVFDAPCALPDLDARLEGGLRPAAGVMPSLRFVATAVFQIAGEP